MSPIYVQAYQKSGDRSTFTEDSRKTFFPFKNKNTQDLVRGIVVVPHS